MFESVDTKESFPKREEKILNLWLKNNTFEKSIENRKNAPLFSYYDGPPFATGLPHYGHLLAGTIKDVVPRYKTMKGFRVPRRFGWDCHGLPLENEVEKTKNLNGAASIEAFGIANFNEECRSIALRYTSEWKKTVLRMGRWVDFDNPYRTMDLPFMESVWWVFKELYNMGLVYEGFKVMPYSAKLGTPLSNFEASENYKDVEDPSLTVAIPLLNEENTSLLIWTTTPWTLISNIAIVCGANIEYVKLKDKKSEKFYILAKERTPLYFQNPDDYEIVKYFTGNDLVGKSYIPPFQHFSNLRKDGAFQIISDGFVTLEDGTGLVHAAPGFGEDDFNACKSHNLPFICPVDQNGQFNDEVPEFKGRFVKDCDKEIIRNLKERKLVFKHESCRHRYPFCWRSDTPLIYKAVATWFVAVEKIKDDILKANDQIFWVPEHIKYGRFGKWLEGARDWAISRNRYWGTPIPIWLNEAGEIRVIGSIKELEEKTNTKINDLHREKIDHLTFEENGSVFRRIPEVFDCWFESGSMPYAQNHYPFENKELFLNNYPADFIAEGLDQTRGWFYTLTVLAAALFKKPAFKNVIVNGIILAEDGAKMSKRLKNYPDPEEVLSKHGADAIRLYMINSPAMKAEDLCFSEAGVEVVLRQVLLPLWNSYSFFITYARLYNWNRDDIDPNFVPHSTLDRWMISLVNKLIEDVTSSMDRYDLTHSVHPFVDFIDQLTNWYIRRSRRRFWSDEASKDRHEAFCTLYTVLLNVVKIAAPFVPFITESIFSNLRSKSDPESVHLTDFPVSNKNLRDYDLEESMSLVQQAVSLGHSLRKAQNLRVRQPLSTAYVISGVKEHLILLQKEERLIADELNVVNVTFESDESKFVLLKAKPNFRVLGKKLGKKMKQAQDAINNLSQEKLSTLLKGDNITLKLDDEDILFTPEDIEVVREIKEGIVAANLGEITVALDTHLTTELIYSGIAREVINKVNVMRKESGLDISDRINVTIQTDGDAKLAIQKHADFISNEILALSIDFASCNGTELDLNGIPAIISIETVSNKK